MEPRDALDPPPSLVAEGDRHLKWRAFDGLARALMILCGVALACFVTTVFCDMVTRTIGRPWLWLQEVTSIFFIYGIFTGTAVAVRRNDHLLLTAVSESLGPRMRIAVETMNRLVVAAVGLCMVWFGFVNFTQGFGSFRMPSLTPIAWWYLAIPLSGVFIVLFSIEQIANSFRNSNAGNAQPPVAGDIAP